MQEVSTENIKMSAENKERRRMRKNKGGVNCDLLQKIICYGALVKTFFKRIGINKIWLIVVRTLQDWII